MAVRTLGESAEPSGVEVEFYHCKYSTDDAPGRRVDDLYEVCGQTQKSISWASSRTKKTDLFTHLLRRESSRENANASTRIEVGTREQLLTLRDMSRLLPVNFKFYIVQPGLSKANASADQLLLLSVTKNYLAETYQLRFGVIGSE